MDWKRIPFRGTIFNAITVAVGSLVGLAAGSQLPESFQVIGLTAIGLVNLGIGVKLFLETKNTLIPTIAIIGGVLIGAAIGIDQGVAAVADVMRGWLGGGSNFNEGLITASVLFCVGPMTLLGCLKDGLEHDIELLSVKSIFDLIAATFLAATLGIGVLASVLVVIVVQGLLTAFARPLRALVDRPELAAEASAAGGAILLAIGINLLGLRDIKIATELFLPALVLAPLVALFFHQKRGKEESQSVPNG